MSRKERLEIQDCGAAWCGELGVIIPQTGEGKRGEYHSIIYRREVWVQPDVRRTLGVSDPSRRGVAVVERTAKRDKTECQVNG